MNSFLHLPGVFEDWNWGFAYNHSLQSAQVVLLKGYYLESDSSEAREILDLQPITEPSMLSLPPEGQGVVGGVVVDFHFREVTRVWEGHHMGVARVGYLDTTQPQSSFHHHPHWFEFKLLRLVFLVLRSLSEMHSVNSLLRSTLSHWLWWILELPIQSLCDSFFFSVIVRWFYLQVQLQPFLYR